eukprot:CAMPEP_0179043114 /NCGR_PEP_ID=MMETSP0796-20121207/17003_1 /TAXON_ID=73915 /ORGANISM="Pyrodinium bahamense, Strain pbaha01" /LENGTH=179 /DNA_ID=CAMNT_0020739495 /DNA_START=44 /DNA_END=581 /DNA_ORIENTATION=+
MNYSFPDVVVLAGAGLSGMVLGALSFVSRVDTKLLLDSRHKPAVISEIFPIWFLALHPPARGRDFMVPLIWSTALTNALAAYLTKKFRLLLSSASALCIGLYTGMFMKESTIDPLMKGGEPGAVAAFTEEFCKRHHLRVLMASVGLFNSMSLLALADMLQAWGPQADRSLNAMHRARAL